jgi:hypothetical protein
MVDTINWEEELPTPSNIEIIRYRGRSAYSNDGYVGISDALLPERIDDEYGLELVKRLMSTVRGTELQRYMIDRLLSILVRRSTTDRMIGFEIIPGFDGDDLHFYVHVDLYNQFRAHSRLLVGADNEVMTALLRLEFDDSLVNIRSPLLIRTVGMDDIRIPDAWHYSQCVETTPYRGKIKSSDIVGVVVKSSDGTYILLDGQNRVAAVWDSPSIRVIVCG